MCIHHVHICIHMYQSKIEFRRAGERCIVNECACVLSSSSYKYTSRIQMYITHRAREKKRAYTYTHRAREEELAAVDVHLSMLHALMQVRILTV